MHSEVIPLPQTQAPCFVTVAGDIFSGVLMGVPIRTFLPAPAGAENHLRRTPAFVLVALHEALEGAVALLFGVNPLIADAARTRDLSVWNHCTRNGHLILVSIHFESTVVKRNELPNS